MCVLFNRKYTNQLFECMEENYLNLLKTSPNLMNLIHSTTTFGMPPRKSKKLSGRLWPSNLFTFFFCFFLMNFIFSSQEHVSPILSPLVKNQTKIWKTLKFPLYRMVHLEIFGFPAHTTAEISCVVVSRKWTLLKDGIWCFKQSEIEHERNFFFDRLEHERRWKKGKGEKKR